MASRVFSFSLVRSKSTTSLASNSSSRSTLTSHSNNSVLGLSSSSSSHPHVLQTSTSSPSLSSQISSSRPRLNKHKKRVSFDVAAASALNTENLLSFDAPPCTPSTASRWKARRSEIDGLDVRAVLAAGIIEWRTQVDGETEEGVQNA